MYDRIVELVTMHYKKLKDIFVGGCIETGDPPDFKRKQFIKFLKKAGVVDKRMSENIIDTYFKATNFEEEDQDQNNDFALNRFEFIEILLRIAIGKYVESGKEKNIAHAFSILL